MTTETCWLEEPAVRREWATERSVLPLLLCVAPDPAQEKRILRIAQALLVNTPALRVRSTTAPQLVATGPLSAIWLQDLPPREQATQTLATRQALFGKSTLMVPRNKELSSS